MGFEMGTHATLHSITTNVKEMSYFRLINRLLVFTMKLRLASSFQFTTYGYPFLLSGRSCHAMPITGSIMMLLIWMEVITHWSLWAGGRPVCNFTFVQMIPRGIIFVISNPLMLTEWDNLAAVIIIDQNYRQTKKKVGRIADG